MPRLAIAGSLILLILGGLLACKSGGRDPILGEPNNNDIQQVRLGNQIVDFQGTNLVYLDAAGQVLMDFNLAIDENAINESTEFRIVLVGDDTDAFQNPTLNNPDAITLTRKEFLTQGRLEVVNRELGIVAWKPTSGNLRGVLKPGVRYRVLVESFFSRVGIKEHDTINVSGEQFILLPRSTASNNFDTRLETDGLVNRIRIGNVQVERADNTLSLVPLDVASTITVDLATNVNPGTFVTSLVYDLVINNLTQNRSFTFTITDLLRNGTFTFPGDLGNVVVYTKTTPGGFASFVDAETGQTVNISELGDELELRIDRVTSRIANGDQLTLRDRAFRLLHTFS